MQRPVSNAVLDVDLASNRACLANVTLPLQRQDPHNGIQQRGFAGTIGADDGDNFVGVERRD
jgi:hypothetical protein